MIKSDKIIKTKNDFNDFVDLAKAKYQVCYRVYNAQTGTYFTVSGSEIKYLELNAFPLKISYQLFNETFEINIE
jgi:hypothetical protein